ncbi:MAG: nuclear transport factor 2 family protein [Steroidobacteraceae bacterium]
MDRRAFGAAVLSGGASLAALSQPAPMPCGRPKGGLGEQDLRDYIAAFNRSDFDGFSKYYAADVKFEGRAGTFNSRDQVVAFYREVKSRMVETVTIKDLIVGENDMVANIVTNLLALRDWAEFPTGPLKKGQIIISENFAWYEMKNAKFVHIRSAGYRRS